MTVKMSKISTVGVVGAGQMGNGIAHVCALGGYDVLINDADPARIDSAIQTITKNMTRQVQRGIIKQADMDAALKRTKGAAKMSDLAACDLVIESIVEQDEAKRKVFADLKAVLRADAVVHHWQLAVPFYGDERRALPHARMHVIKYGQYHPEPVWARERLVTMRGPEHWQGLVDEVFADRFDAGRTRELSPSDAVVPALQDCSE